MKRAWFLILTQWLCVLLYAKIGYYTEGEEASHWARFFSVTNQLVLCGWIYNLSRYKLPFKLAKTALTFNVGLAILWCQHYIRPLNVLVEKYCEGIFCPILGYIVLCLFITFVIDKK